MLLSLTASRVSGFQHLNIGHMIKGDNKLTLYFAKLHKSWRKGNSLSPLKLFVSLKIPNYV